MKKLFFYLLPLLAAGWLLPMGGCKKDTGPVIKPPPIIDYSKLPEATQTGANTFGCLVNDQVWVPRVPIGAVTIYEKAAFVNEKTTNGSGFLESRLVEGNRDEYLTFSFTSSNFEPSVFKTTQDLLKQRFFPDFRVLHESYTFDKNDDFNNLEITTIDTLKNFISGAFDFRLYNSDKSKTIVITKGRFDLPYYPQ